MKRQKFFPSKRTEREHWLQDCVAMFRDAVLSRRAITGEPMPACISQIALEFGVTEPRGVKLFYNKLCGGCSHEARHTMKLAALRECETRKRLLLERLDAANARRRQYELELGQQQCCGTSIGYGNSSATGERTSISLQPIDGLSGM